MPKKQSIQILFAPLLFLLIYYQVFTANYFFSDDIHQLWFNKYAPAYPASASQGRWISGLIFDASFGSISLISELRYLHIFSLFSWVLTVLLWQFIFSKWIKQLGLERRYFVLLNVFIVCCIPVAIYIGWASCIEMFFGIVTGLLSGHFLFTSLLKNSRPSILAILLCVVTGLASLFTYQNTFGMFLFPFFIYYLKEQKLKPAKIVITGLLFYCVVILIYFIVYKIYANTNHLPQSDRARISTDVLGKLSFLFSDPLPMTFSVNLLYSARSIFSQIAAPLMMAIWAISIFIRFKKDRVYKNAMRIIVILLLLLFMYLPSMLAYENFASYRTLFVFSLAVFYLLIDQLFFFIKQERNKTLATYMLCIFLIVTGFYNFNFQFVNPLKAEYNAFSGYMKKNSAIELQTVYFIRAGQFMFSPYFLTRPYKDEFGLPSTNKDWVPGPLVKQYVYESTGNRSLADKIKVVQFADTAEYNNAKVQLSNGDLLIDMNKIFNDYISDKRNSK